MKREEQILNIFQQVARKAISVDDATSLLAQNNQTNQHTHTLEDKIETIIQDFPEQFNDENILQTTQAITIVLISSLSGYKNVSVETSLENLGMNSLLITNAANTFGNLFDIVVIPTILYEQSTIERLSQFLVNQHREKLLKVYLDKKIDLTDKTTPHKPSVLPTTYQDDFDSLLNNAFDNKKQDERTASLLLNIDSYTFDIKVLGRGKPLLFLGGLGNEYSDFQDFCISCLQHYKIFFVELPGFGESTLFTAEENNFHTWSSYIHQCLNILNLESTSIIAYSMGGIFAQHYCMIYPQQVNKLILINTSSYTKKMPNLLETIVKQGSETDINYLKNHTPIINSKVLHYYEQLMKNLDETSEQAIDTPGLWICGELDPVSQFATEALFTDLIPNLKKITIPNSGHFLPWTHTKELLKATQCVMPDSGEA